MGKYFLLECYDKVSELGVDVQIIGTAFIPCCCIGGPKGLRQVQFNTQDF